MRPSRTSSPARSIAARTPRARVLALGELARALQLDRRTGERVGEHVVQLACDPATLRNRRRPQLLLACILELGKQQLGRVLARTRLLDEEGDQPEQRAQKRRREHRRRRTAGKRLGEHEPRRHADRQHDSQPQRQARDGHPHRGAAGELSRPARLQRNQRHSRGAHRSDHSSLHDNGSSRQSCLARRAPATPRTRPARPRRRAPHRAAGGRMPGDRADHDRGDHDQPQRTQRVTLAAKPLTRRGRAPPPRVRSRPYPRVDDRTPTGPPKRAGRNPADEPAVTLRRGDGRGPGRPRSERRPRSGPSRRAPPAKPSHRSDERC